MNHQGSYTVNIQYFVSSEIKLQIKRKSPTPTHNFSYNEGIHLFLIPQKVNELCWHTTIIVSRRSLEIPKKIFRCTCMSLLNEDEVIPFIMIGIFNSQIVWNNNEAKCSNKSWVCKTKIYNAFKKWSKVLHQTMYTIYTH